MKNLIKASALMLTAAALLSSCQGKTELPTVAETEEKTAVITTKAETVINKEGEVLEIATQNENYTIYVAPTQKPTVVYTYADSTPVSYTYNIAGNNNTPANEGNDSATNAKTTAKKKLEVIEEKSNGISLITKSTVVMAGSSATVMIQGNAGEKYLIDFYETSSSKASYKGLETKTADENGMVTWTFRIPDTCESGNHKIYISDKSAKNYIQTYITVS